MSLCVYVFYIYYCAIFPLAFIETQFLPPSVFRRVKRSKSVHSVMRDSSRTNTDTHSRVTFMIFRISARSHTMSLSL